MAAACCTRSPKAVFTSSKTGGQDMHPHGKPSMPGSQKSHRNDHVERKAVRSVGHEGAG